MRISSVIIAILASFLLQAQENSVPERVPVFRQVSYPFLPSITASYFFFSEDGLMWFSTAKGLTSFDGSGIIYHSTSQQSNELQLNTINTIAEDRDHNLYIGTRIALLYFDRKHKTISQLQYTFHDIKKSVAITIASLYIDNSGVVYAGTISQGLIIYDPRSKKTEHLNLDKIKPDSWEDRINNTVKCIAAHAKDPGKLWMGSYNGIYVFDKKSKSLNKNFKVTTPQYNMLGVERAYYDVEKMDVANDSTIWFNIWSGGFCSYNTNTGKAVIYEQDDWLTKGKYIPSYVIPSFVKLTSDNYLLAINNNSVGCGIFNTKTKTIRFLRITPDQESQDRLTFCEQDRRGNIWVLRNGLLYVSVPEYSRLQNVKIRKQIGSDHRHHNEMRGAYFDEAARLYYFAVRFADGIYVLDTNFKIQRIIPGSLCINKYAYKESCADHITKDGSGRFWVTGWQTYVMLPGQKKFDLVGRVFPGLEWINRKGEFADVLTTKQGDILLQHDATGNLYVIHHKTLSVDTIPIPLFDNKKNFRISFSPLSYDSSRDVAYFSNDYGIAGYEFQAKRVREFSYKEIFGDTIPKQEILKSTLDAEGRIWLIKNHYGIRIINPETLACIDSIPWGTRGLMDGYYVFIVGGDKDFVFLRGEHGTVVYNYKEQKSFLFDNNNGLVYPAPYSMLHRNHHLLLGQSSSIQYYDSRNFSKNNFNFRPSLNTVTADTVEFNPDISESGEAIKLPHNRNTISLSFSAAEFVFPERIEYAYMLKGIDDGWKYTNYFTRKITYTKLPPGSYVFRLKAQMEGGNWNTDVVEYTIIITPAWWQTEWFRLLSILTGMAIIIYFIRRRTGFIRRTEQQKSRHEKELLDLEAKALRAQMNPHFIFNCLNSIKSLIQEHKEEKSVTYLTTFSKLIRTLFNNADKKEISLYDEIDTCKLYLQLEAMRFDTKFSYSVNVDGNIDLKSIQVPALIIQPFIENAIWHGIIPKETGGRIEINVEQAKGNIKVIIDDNGIGREASVQNKAASGITHQSKGVNLTQSRLDLENRLNETNAQLVIIDKKDDSGRAAGTRIVLTFANY